MMLWRADRSSFAYWARPALASIALAAVWFVLAWRTPTSTHHFAPLVVAAAWGFLAESHHQGEVRFAAGAGVAVAVFALILLGLSDRLLGPTLWDGRPSWPELLGSAILGGAITLIRGQIGTHTPPS